MVEVEEVVVVGDLAMAQVVDMDLEAALDMALVEEATEVVEVLVGKAVEMDPVMVQVVDLDMELVVAVEEVVEVVEAWTWWFSVWVWL